MSTLRRLFGVFLFLPLVGLAAEPAATMTTDRDYRIASRDVLQFQIYNQPDMLTMQRITSTGEVRLPLVGTVQLGGMTLREAEVRLESLYRDGGYFVEPQVILAVQFYGERFVSVLGQVKDPARVPLPAESNTIGILQAVTQAGGFTRVSRTDSVQVLRTGDRGQDERLTVNMDELLNPKTATRAQEFQLKAGDIVFVPERVF